jgi:hypothetical protein
MLSVLATNSTSAFRTATKGFNRATQPNYPEARQHAPSICAFRFLRAAQRVIPWLLYLLSTWFHASSREEIISLQDFKIESVFQ